MSKKKYELKMVMLANPESKEILALKNGILSGEMKRDLNKNYDNDKDEMKALSITLKEIQP